MKGITTTGNFSVSHESIFLGTGKDQIPIADIVDAVRFLSYLVNNHPEIKDAYTAFTAKQRILK